MSDAGQRLPTTVQRTFARLVSATAKERILLSTMALVLALIVGAILLFVSGAFVSGQSPFLEIAGVEFYYNPFEVYSVMLNGAFGSMYGLGITLRQTSLLILAGVAVAVTFKANLFNIGTQGQFALGGLAAAVAVQYLAGAVPESFVGGLILLVVGLVASAIVGGLYGAIPGVLLAYYEANEVITTIMLNFIASAVAFTLVRGFFRPGPAIQTAIIPAHVPLPSIIFPRATKFTLLVFIPALLVAIGTYFLLRNSTLGYNIRLSGEQPEAAEYSGVDAKQIIIRTFTLSGILGGLTGGVFVFMVLGYWEPSLPQLGFDGITVSVLAGNNPLAVIPAATLFGVIKSGAIALDLQLGVPRELASVLRGIIILFVAMPEFMRMIGYKLGFGERGTTSTTQTEEVEDNE